MDEVRHGPSAEILHEISGFLQRQGQQPEAPLLPHIAGSHTRELTQRLPAEILAECFIFICLRDLISASHVSSHWRATAISFPALWAHISIVSIFARSDEVLRMAIARAGQLPVDLEYAPSSNRRPVSPELAAVVGENMHRLRSFMWAGDSSPVDLRLRAPLLQTFENKEAFYAIPSEFLGGEAGRLHTLCLGDALFPDSCPALATVTHLRASYPGYIDAPLHFERIFALCPQLEVLNLRTIFEHTRVRLPAGPFPPTLKVVKLHALVDCDLVHLYGAWAHGVSGSLPHVRLKMPLTPAYNVAPFLDGAVEIAMTFAREDHKARIVADLPNARRRILVLYELEQVFEPAAVLARIFRNMTPSTIAGVRSLRVPLSVLHHVLSARIQWSALARLDVDMFAHDGYDTTPYEFGETYRRFRWSTLDCLRVLPLLFPVMREFSLVLHRKEPADSPDLEDARELLRYVSAQGAGAFPVARVHGFPTDVVRAVAEEAPMHPWLPFAAQDALL